MEGIVCLGVDRYLDDFLGLLPGRVRLFRDAQLGR